MNSINTNLTKIKDNAVFFPDYASAETIVNDGTSGTASSVPALNWEYTAQKKGTLFLSITMLNGDAMSAFDIKIRTKDKDGNEVEKIIFKIILNDTNSEWPPKDSLTIPLNTNDTLFIDKSILGNWKNWDRAFIKSAVFVPNKTL